MIKVMYRTKYSPNGQIDSKKSRYYKMLDVKFHNNSNAGESPPEESINVHHFNLFMPIKKMAHREAGRPDNWD